MKKIYIGVIVLLLLLASVIGYRKFQKRAATSPSYQAVQTTQTTSEADELSQEQESFNQDANELEGIEKDASLDNLDQDLTDMSGTSTSSNTKVDTAYLESLEKDLGSEISTFSTDSQDLEGINGDTALSALDSELSVIK